MSKIEESEEKFPAEAYRKAVLSECFADAKHYFLDAYIRVDLAHAVMLAEQGIITTDEAKSILKAIRSLDLNKITNTAYDGTFEDLFYLIQREIIAQCGPDAGGKLHTARSRNDIDVTIYRLRLRPLALELIDAVTMLRKALLDLAEQNVESLMPAYTHTQPAQPTTLGHFLLAMAEVIGRDIKRLQRAFENLNKCPLGAAAITTSGFPISRMRTARLLGFSEPTVNSYASIAATDYFAELLAAANVFLLTLGKITQEFLLMAMDEFRIIRLPDGFVQGSSIMPQKRNPVALEHVRAIASRALGESLGVFTAVHNTPFGDINDVEDDLQPLILISLKNAVRSANLLGVSLRNTKFDIAKMEAKAGENFITATELADTLVRREGISFRQAHRIVAKAIAAALEGGEELRADSIRRIFKAETGNELSMSQEEITETFSPKHFVEVRNILGGPSPDEVRRALAVERTREKEDLEWRKIVEDFLSNAQNELNDAVDKILSV